MTQQINEEGHCQVSRAGNTNDVFFVFIPFSQVPSPKGTRAGTTCSILVFVSVNAYIIWILKRGGYLKDWNEMFPLDAWRANYGIRKMPSPPTEIVMLSIFECKT